MISNASFYISWTFRFEDYNTSTTQNSGCMVAATALLVPAVYTVVKLLGTILWGEDESNIWSLIFNVQSLWVF